MGAHTSAVLDAVNSGSLEQLTQTLQSLNSEGNSINIQDYLDYYDEDGKTALHWAVSKGYNEMIKELLKYGSKTNIVDDHGNTPLDSAVYSGNKEAASILIESGANINCVNKDGMTPLHWAVTESRFECIELLLQKGADINLKNNKNQTPFEMIHTMKSRQRSKLETFLNDMSQKYKISLHPSPSPQTRKLDEEKPTNNNNTTNSSTNSVNGTSSPVISPNLKALESEREQLRLRRLVGICKLWGLVKYLHPYLIDKRIDWDLALIQSLPKLTSSVDTNQFRDIVNNILSTLGDPNTRCIDSESLRQMGLKIESLSGYPSVPTGTNEQQPYVKFTEDKIAIVVATHHEKFQDYSVMVNFLNSFKEAQSRGQAVVFDFRLKQGNSINFAAHPFKFMVYEAIKTILDRPIGLPSYRQRIYSGYPQQRNFGNVFHSGMMIIEAEQLIPSQMTEEAIARPWVFLINKFTPDSIIDLISGLRCANLTKVVFEKQEGDIDLELGVPTFTLALGEDLVVQVRKNQRLNSDGTLGFVPDLVVTTNEAQGATSVDLPLHRAIKVASGAESIPPLNPTKATVYAPRAVDNDYSEMELPNQEYRILSLFRFWNIIQYFFPYKDLMDKEWESVLIEYIPKLEKVTSPLEYHRTIASLVAQCSDSHATCTSNILNSHLGTHFPPVEVRLIEGKTIITHLFTDIHGNKPKGLSLGDEVLSIGNESVNLRKNYLSNILSASTPQALQWKIHQKLLCGEKDSHVRIEVLNKNGDKVSVPLIRSMHHTIAKKAPERPPCYIMQNGLIGYINTVTLQLHDLEKSLETIRNTKCLILDIRGYPKGIIYQIAPRLIRKSVVVAITQTPLLLPDFLYSELESCLLEEKHHLHPSSQWKYQGKVFALINEDTISHAEHSCLYLESCTDVTFIGTTSNGANGNVSNCHLPGGILIAFTGLGAMHGNKTQLQRRGIIPDVLVHPTINGIRNGKDEIFEKAVTHILEIYNPPTMNNNNTAPLNVNFTSTNVNQLNKPTENVSQK